MTTPITPIVDYTIDEVTSSGVPPSAGHTPDWLNVRDFGVVADGVTNDSPGFQAAVDEAGALASSSKTIHLYASGTIRLNDTVELASNVIYDFTDAVFLPGAGTDNTFVFHAVSATDFQVLGGHFSTAAFTPTTTLPTGTYTTMTAIHVLTCARFLIWRTRIDGYFGGVNVYDSTHGIVEETVHYNGNAGIAVIATDPDTQDIKVLNNVIIGCGDDGITFSPTSGGIGNVNFCEARGNYIDKTRIGAVAAAVGIRAGSYGGSTGTVNNLIIANNTMKDMAEQGLYLHNLTDAVVEGNLIVGYGFLPAPAANIGINSTLRASRVRFANNVIVGPQTTGNPGISSEFLFDSTICGNTVIADVDTGAGAIWFADGCSGNTVSENHLENAHGGAYVEAGSSDDNKILGNYTPIVSGAAITLAGSTSVVNRFLPLGVYVNNAAAVAAGLLPGEFYEVTGSDPRQVAVVF